MEAGQPALPQYSSPDTVSTPGQVAAGLTICQAGPLPSGANEPLVHCVQQGAQEDGVWDQRQCLFTLRPSYWKPFLMAPVDNCPSGLSVLPTACRGSGHPAGLVQNYSGQQHLPGVWQRKSPGSSAPLGKSVPVRT